MKAMIRGGMNSRPYELIVETIFIGQGIQPCPFHVWLTGWGNQ
jgi:hypothetical protein